MLIEQLEKSNTKASEKEGLNKKRKSNRGRDIKISYKKRKKRERGKKWSKEKGKWRK